MGEHAHRRRLLVAAMLVDTLGGGLLAPFELIYAIKIAGLSLTRAGVILSVAAAAGIAVGPIAGAAVDRIGPVRVVAVANGLGVAGCLTLLLWTNGYGYALGAFFLSTNLRVFWGAFTPLVASIASGAELEQWFGRLRGARYIGIVSGEALSGPGAAPAPNPRVRGAARGAGLRRLPLRAGGRLDRIWRPLPGCAPARPGRSALPPARRRPAGRAGARRTPRTLRRRPSDGVG